MTQEELAKNILSAIKNNQIKDHVKDDFHEFWIVNNVDDDNKSGIYKLEIIKGVNKSNKKYCHHNIYRFDFSANSYKIVNFGIYKKKILYNLGYTLENNKIFHKIVQNKPMILTLIHSIKQNPNNWFIDKSSMTISGSMNDSQYIIKAIPQTNKKGNIFYRVQCFKDGVLFLKGSQLMRLFNI